jgi:hypothetical protein
MTTTHQEGMACITLIIHQRLHTTVPKSHSCGELEENSGKALSRARFLLGASGWGRITLHGAQPCYQHTQRTNSQCISN